jgi:hypothetical protein
LCQTLKRKFKNGKSAARDKKGTDHGRPNSGVESTESEFVPPLLGNREGGFLSFDEDSALEHGLDYVEREAAKPSKTSC